MPKKERVAKASVAGAVGAVVAFKTGKAGVLGAVVQAHPVVFGVCAAVVVGLIVYNVVKSKKERKNKEKKLTYLSHDDDTKKHRDDQKAKLVTNSSAPVSNDSDSNLRKRPVTKSAPSENATAQQSSTSNNLSEKSTAQQSSTSNNFSEKSTVQQSSTSNNLSEKSSGKKSILTGVKEVQTDLVDINQTDDSERKVLPDKNIPAMVLEENASEHSCRNIPVPDDEIPESWPEARSHFSGISNWNNISSVKSADKSERKKYKKKIYKAFQKYVDKMIKEKLVPLSAESSDSLPFNSVPSSSNNSSEKETDNSEKGMYEHFKKFIENMNNLETSGPHSECSISMSLESGSSSGQLLTEEPEKCVACKQNPVNTHAQPCNHRYMCSDCAVKFFELYKKCKMCRAKIEKFVVEEDQ